MSLGLIAATVLQTFFVIVFLFILMPFRPPVRKALTLMGAIMAVLCITAGILAACYGADFLPQYGYLLIAAPLFMTVYFLSKAKGSRFLFVLLTILIFHRMICTLLMSVRIYSGGFTALYFLMNFLLFGALLYGGWRLKTDFHKIIFTYHKEFDCLTVILLLLLMLVWLFSPIVDQNQVDSDILLVAALLYLLILLFYFYIGVSFRSFSKRLEAERSALSLGHQMQAAQDHIALMQDTREKAKLYRHDLRHHLLLIGELLDNGSIEQLRDYLLQIQKDLDAITPTDYCPNEAANLIFSSFALQAQKLGVQLELDAQIPQSLSISNTELCTLLSNALENAVAATSRVTDGREKTVKLSAGMLDGKLLLVVENPYAGTVRIENGLPQTDCKGHGFGTKSMEVITEKYGGLSSFEAQNGVFTVRLVV